uniref:NB-ARC domain-containing protein n=1 Tax=Oryza brachyantha TaxID=4533 RepID=J3N132_ORYBR
MNEIKSDRNVPKELGKLQYSLQPIRVVLLEAERKQSMTAFGGGALKRQVDKGLVTRAKCICIPRLKLSIRLLKKKLSRRLLKKCLSSRIREVREKLNEIAANKDFGLTEWEVADQSSEEEERESYSFVYQPNMIGRGSCQIARDEIVHDILRAAEGDDLSVLPLVGLGGMGKTALARLTKQGEVQQYDVGLYHQ